LLNLPEGFFWRDQVERVRDSGAEVREFPQRRKDGTVFPAEISLKFVVQEDCTYIVAAARDITDRKQGEKDLLRYQEQLRKLASKLSRAEEQERRRIAVGLHDQIGQPLSVIKMKLGRMQQETGQNGESFAEIREFLDRAIQETRSLTFELSPPILHELGLKAALEWLGEQFFGLHGLHCHLVDEDGEFKLVSGELQMVLFRSIRELLVNIVKHARTSQAWITMQKEKDQLRIEVRDQGAGFLADEGMASKDGFGLFNIRERLAHFGGDLAIDSFSGRGTAVVLHVPITGC
jgi:signal transduction histidine kinase